MSTTVFRAALLVLAAYCCQARVIAFGVQDGAVIASRPSYSDFSDTQPRPVEIVQSGQDKDSDAYLVEPNQMQLAWAYQQVDLLNSLQSFMLTPRKPCGHSSRPSGAPTTPLTTHTMNPLVMSYLASSRLPSLPAFDTFTEATDDEASADSSASGVSLFDSSSLPTAADDLVSSNILAALSGSVGAQAEAESDPETQAEPELSEDDFAVTQFRQAVEDIVSDRRQARVVDSNPQERAVPMEGSIASAEWTAFDQLAQERGDLDDSLDWSIVNDDGSINWAVLLFGLLCIACGAVWFSLLRTWCALGRSCLSCPRRQRQEQFLTLSADDMTSPLLAPLQHEGLGTPTGTMKASDFLGAKKIEIASDHANNGVEYVTIAYAPLKGEA